MIIADICLEVTNYANIKMETWRLYIRFAEKISTTVLLNTDALLASSWGLESQLGPTLGHTWEPRLGSQG